VTRYTAEHHDEEAGQHRVWSTAGTVTLIGSTIAALIVIPASGLLARLLLHDSRYSAVFVALALGLAPLRAKRAATSDPERAQGYAA